MNNCYQENFVAEVKSMNFILKTLSTFFYVTVIISCNSKPGASKSETGKNNSKSRSEYFVKTGEDSLADVQNAQIELALGLDKLDSGFANTEIRISFWYAWSDSCKYVIINRKENSWNSFAYFCKLNIDSSTLLSIDKKVERKNPFSDWDIFLDSLQILGIYELKNYKEIPNYELCTDSDVIYFEIAKNGKYQIYEYPWCSSVNENSATQAYSVVRILDFIQKELGLRLFPRPKLNQN